MYVFKPVFSEIKRSSPWELLNGLFQYLGWGPSVMAVVLSILAGIGAFINSLPIPMVILICLAMCVSILFLAAALARNKSVSTTLEKTGDYISLEKAAQQAHDFCEKKYQSANKTLRNTHLYSMWRFYPLHGKKLDSNTVIPLENTKEIVERLDIEDGVCKTRFHKDICIKKSDLKQYIKTL